MIKITRQRGFHMRFENGFAVSVQFGPGNYCQNYETSFDKEREAGEKGSSDAECAVLTPAGNLIAMPGWDDTVKGRMTPNEILALMNEVAALDPDMVTLDPTNALIEGEVVDD